MILNVVSYPRSGNSFFTTTLLQFGTNWWYEPQPLRGRLHVHFKPVGRVYETNVNNWYGIDNAPWNNGLVDGVEDPQPNDYIIDPHSVYVYKRHDLPDNYAGPRIVVIRDGRDVLCSFAHHNVVHEHIIADPTNQEIFARQEPPLRLVNEAAWKIVNDPNAQWGRLVDYALKHPNTKAVVRYEAMKVDPVGTARDALRKLDYHVDVCREALTWDQLHEHAPHFFRRGRPGGWRELDPEVVKAFVAKNGDTLQRLKYI